MRIVPSELPANF